MTKRQRKSGFPFRESPAVGTQPGTLEGSHQQGRSGGLFLAVATGLLLCRQLMPAESTANGDTALIVFAWCLFGSVVCWWQWRNQNSAFLKFDLIDLALALIAGGHVVALSAMWSLGGQMRAGWSTTWEWLGNLVALWVIRRLWRETPSHLPLVVLLGVGMTVSLQGIYQHHLLFPQQRAEVVPLVENWRTLLAEEPAGSSELSRQRWEQKKQDLERQLYASGIPSDLHTQEMFLQRLHSSEAIGRFALANTLAGLLGGCLLVSLAVLIDLLLKSRAGIAVGKGKLGLAALISIVIAYCLLLTKSRTAWVGGAVGFCYLVAGVLWQARYFQSSKVKIPRWLVPAGLTTMVLLVVVGFATGGLDLEVITEANKSLKYRLEYWSASFQMLSERWLFGTGPGNFRQNYLAYKLPDSSEEILDPHNMWLDAWSGGGILALGGTFFLVALLFTVAWRALWGNSRGKELEEQHSAVSGTSADRDEGGSFFKGDGFPPFQACSLKMALWTSVLTAVSAQFLASPQISQPLEEWLLLTVVLVSVTGMVQGICAAGSFSAVGLSAGALALFVHLQGAGGFGMPAMFQLLVILGVGGSQTRKVWSVSHPSGLLFVGATLLGLAFAGWIVVVAPALAALQAQSELATASSPAAVKAALTRWAQADSLSPEPWLQGGNFLCGSGYSSRNPLMMREGVAAIEAAIQRDPANYAGYRMLAQNQFRLAELTGELDDLENSVEAQRQALVHYPHLARLYVEMSDYLAELWQRTGQDDLRQELVEAAQDGLQLHAVNAQAGHPDRMLSEQDQEKLRKVLELSQEKANKPTGEP